MPLYAHTPNEVGQWHELMDHLYGVAVRAKEFGIGKGYPAVRIEPRGDADAMDAMALAKGRWNRCT